MSSTFSGLLSITSPWCRIHWKPLLVVWANDDSGEMNNNKRKDKREKMKDE
jgi:hypothetical protein